MWIVVVELLIFGLSVVSAQMNGEEFQAIAAQVSEQEFKAIKAIMEAIGEPMLFCMIFL